MALLKWFGCFIVFIAARVQANTRVCYSIANVDTKLHGMRGIALGNLKRSVEVELKALVVDVDIVSDWNYTMRMENEGFLGEFSVGANAIVTKIRSVPFVLQAGFKTVKFTILVPPECDQSSMSVPFNVIPACLMLLPLLTTIGLIFATKNLMFSLFMGAYCSAFLLYDYNPITAMARLFDTQIPDVLRDNEYSILILYSWMLTGLSAVIAKSGGAKGIKNLIVKHGITSVGGQLATFLMGFGLFFDDYTSMILVGNAARPITDIVNVSREKLAFIVDCTAAPIASIVPISSWVGYEVSLIGDALVELKLEYSPFAVFIDTIQYRFYSILLLAFVGILIYTSREFGPMLSAERKARAQDVRRNSYETSTVMESNDDSTSAIFIEAAISPRSRNAIIPVVAIVCTMLFGLMCDGYTTIKKLEEMKGTPLLMNAFTAANSLKVLMWSGLASILVPVVLYAVQGIMKPAETLSVWIEGMKDLVEATIVLILAWVFGNIRKQSQISEWLIEFLLGILPPIFLPATVYILSGTIAVCTGSSWSTMTILMPIIVPIAWNLSNQSYDSLLQSIAAILSGAIFGDHCSPNFDTTILTSYACQISVIDHVETQLPYTILVGIISLITCFIPVATNSFYTSYIAIPVGIFLITIAILLFGHKVPTYTTNSQRSSEILFDKDPTTPDATDKL